MKVKAIALAVLMVTSMVALGAPTIGSVGATNPAPPGMSGVPDDQVGPPDHAGGGGPPDHALDNIPTDAAAWSIHASEHADDLEIAIGAVDEELAIVLTDEHNEDGREVALDADTLADAVGHEPAIAHGTHESGETWTSTIEYQDGYAVLEVPHFSSNTVTFEGSIELDATEATSSTSWSYEIQDLDAVDDLEIEIKGERVTEARNKSTIAESETLEIEPRGTAEPEEALMRLEGERTETNESESGFADDGDMIGIGVGGNQEPEGETLTLTGELEESAESYETSAGEDETVDPGISGTLDPETPSGDPGVSVTASASTTSDTQEWPGALTDNEEEEYNSYYPDEGESMTFDVSDINRIDDLSMYLSTGNDDYETDTCMYIDGYHADTVIVDTGMNPSWFYFDGTDVDLSGQDSAVIEIENCYDDGTSTLRIHDEDVTATSTVPEDVTVSLGDDSSNFGDGESKTLEASPGDTIEVSYNEGGVVDLDLEWIQRDGVENIAAEVGSSTVTYDDALDGSIEESVDLSTGSDALSIEYDGETNGLDYGLEWTEVQLSENPTIELDDGEESLFNSGILDEGETVEEPSDLDLGETHTAEVTSDGPVKAEIEWLDVSATKDPEIQINDETTAHDGTLAKGETTTLEASTNWIEEGTNTVDVSLADANGGPEPQVGVSYSHTAATVASAAINSTTWYENIEVSRTFADDQASVTTELPMPDNVVEIDHVELRRDDGEWTSVDEERYNLTGTDLTVDVEDVAAGEEIAVRTRGDKVRLLAGDVVVTEPTVEGNILETTFEVTDAPADGPVEIDVSETAEADRIHQLDTASWDAEEYSRVEAGGVQVFELPQAPTGGEATVSRSPFGAEPHTGDAIFTIENASEPRFTLGPGDTSGDAVDIVYHDTEHGTTYALLTYDDQRTVDTATASSPVTFETDDSEQRYTIDIHESGGTVTMGAPIEEEGSGLVPPWVWLFGAVVLSIGGIALIASALGRGPTVGVRERVIHAPSIPVVDRTPSLRIPGRRVDLPEVREQPILYGGLIIIGLLALELATARSLLEVVLFTVAGPAAPLQELGVILVGILLILGVWWLDNRTTDRIPIWMMGIAAGLTVVYILETIRPGVLLGPVSDGFATVAPLFWLAVIGGGAYFAWGWIQARQTPDTQVTLDLGDDANDDSDRGGWP